MISFVEFFFVAIELVDEETSKNVAFFSKWEIPKNNYSNLFKIRNY